MSPAAVYRVSTCQTTTPNSFYTTSDWEARRFDQAQRRFPRSTCFLRPIFVNSPWPPATDKRERSDVKALRGRHFIRRSCLSNYFPFASGFFEGRRDSQLTNQLKPVHVRHHQVRHDQLRVDLPNFGQRFLSIRRFMHIKAQRQQEINQ